MIWLGVDPDLEVGAQKAVVAEAEANERERSLPVIAGKKC